MDSRLDPILDRPIAKKIALIGSHVPRQCGIATFTADLANALGLASNQVQIDIIAVSDNHEYAYPEQVVYEIAADRAASYDEAADFINRSGYDLLAVQHEYGIFGGRAGDYLLKLVRKVKMPVVATLHTVLDEPNPCQRSVMDELLQLCERVVVMSQKAVEILGRVHHVAEDKVELIHHGIPEISSQRSQDFRKELNIEGPMLLTFGLLSPDKGIQYAIQAMPKIVEQHPKATYVIVGVTHPHIRLSQGEAYREGLVALTDKLGVSDNIRFVDRFVEINELTDYLGATDFYITPYLNANQITSGTLAYAVGSNTAVLSTPYHYATELLGEGRGVIVPFKDSDAIATAVLKLCANPAEYLRMASAAMRFGSQMLWPEVGARYLETYDLAKRSSAERLRKLVLSATPARRKIPVISAPTSSNSAINLEHLTRMTDDTGILQHATYSIPNRAEGYCVDDNARALLLTALLEKQGRLTPAVAKLQSQYFSFVLHAFDPNLRKFRNFMSYGRQWLEKEGSEDSQGRAIWSLGILINSTNDMSKRALAKELFIQSAPAMFSTGSIRTWAYAVLGATQYLETSQDKGVTTLLESLSERLLMAYRGCAKPDWPWVEEKLTYANARIPQAMIEAGRILGNDEMIEAGLTSLGWLKGVQTSESGQFAPIGSDHFFVKGEPRSWFDQQPIEAWASGSACLTAYQISGNKCFLAEAERSHAWFTGENTLGVAVANEETGGCQDRKSVV